jgi:hypothetical protein
MEKDDENYGKYRKEFLKSSCDLLNKSVYDHYKFSWELAILFISSLAIFIKHGDGDVIVIDFITTICLSIAMWAIANIYESNFWYRRNFAIISNIERQFLYQEDEKNIHNYFKEHKKSYDVQDSLKINLKIIIFIIAILVIYHLYFRLTESLYLSNGSLYCHELTVFLPYISLLLLSCCYVIPTINKRKADFEKFISDSPGIPFNEIKKNRHLILKSEK